jgi:hypothetical protein
MRNLVVVLAIVILAIAGCGGGGGDSSGGGGGGGSSGSSSAGALGNSSGDARDQGCKAPSETAEFKGDIVLVCGTVAESAYFPDQNRTTYVYFDAAPPDYTFTGIITASSRSGFNPFPEKQFVAGVKVCIEGIIQIDADGKPFVDVQSALNMVIIQTLETHGEHCAGN